MFNSKISDQLALSFLSKHFLRKMRILIAVVLLVLCSCFTTNSFSSPSVAQAAPAKVGVNGNPWGYDFNVARGKVITSPPSAFCRYFHCIANFGNGRGYVVECRDQMFSKSGGIRGSCSAHRGNWRVLYSH